jgi:hypothetical protein
MSAIVIKSINQHSNKTLTINHNNSPPTELSYTPTILDTWDKPTPMAKATVRAHSITLMAKSPTKANGYTVILMATVNYATPTVLLLKPPLTTKTLQGLMSI